MGYADVNIGVRVWFDEGPARRSHICELQLLLKRVFAVKQKEGHRYLRLRRAIPPRIRSLGEGYLAVPDSAFDRGSDARYYEQIRSAFAKAGVRWADERWVLDCVLAELETTKGSIETEAKAMVPTALPR